MKNNFLKILLFLPIGLIFSIQSFAGNYTWTGAVSTNWSAKSNWSSNIIPTSNDSVTITNQTNNPQLTSSKTVKKITMTSGTLDLNSYTLTVSHYGTFNGGTINNGLLNHSSIGTSSINFNGTTFGAKVIIDGNVVGLLNSTFNDSLWIYKSGSPLNGKGGNTFNSYVYIDNTVSSTIVFSDSLPDIFNGTLEVLNEGTVGVVYLAHRGTGNQFNGTVKVSGGNIYFNYYGTATFSGNVFMYPITYHGKKYSNVYFGY